VKNTKGILIVLLVIASTVFYFAIQFIGGLSFLNNDREVIAELTDNPDLVDFEVIILDKVLPMSHLEASSSFEIGHKQARRYSCYVRLFYAWKHPRGSTSQEENMVLTGFINMEKRVFIESIITGYQYNIPRA
jgi:hypothetical protein